MSRALTTEANTQNTKGGGFFGTARWARRTSAPRRSNRRGIAGHTRPGDIGRFAVVRTGPERPQVPRVGFAAHDKEAALRVWGMLYLYL